MIVWLEDRIVTVANHVQKLKSAGIPYLIFSSPGEVKEFVEENIADAAKMIFIIDIMLHGVHDLSDIGIPNSPTLSGNHAGYVFADRYLRTHCEPLSAAPICFLTERNIDGKLAQDITQLKNKAGGPTEIFQKYKQAQINSFISQINTWHMARRGGDS